MTSNIVKRDKLYVIQHPGKKKPSELIMDAQINKRFKGIWFLTPPSHGHMIRGKVIRKTENGFIFRRDGDPGDWIFTEVTYENFCNEYYKIVYGGAILKDEVSSTEELEKYYHDHFPNYAD